MTVLTTSVTEIYCPPQGGADEIKFTEFFHTLGARFIAGGDYNSKHTYWGSRLITPKGRALLKATSNTNDEIISTRKATYWPSDQNKIPDLLDFFVMRDLSSNYVKIIELMELTSDHIPVLLTLSSNFIVQQRKVSLTNKKQTGTNLDLI